MTIVRDEKLEFDSDREVAEISDQHYHAEKLKKMNILQVKKYYPRVKKE